MSDKTQSRQSIIDRWEQQEKLAMQEEERYIRAGNTLRAAQCKLFREKFSQLKQQYTTGKDSHP